MRMQGRQKMSKEIFEKNLKAMEKWYVPFAEEVRRKELEKEKIEEEIQITTEMSWDGEVIFRVKKEERWLYLGGKRNASEPVEMWLERLGMLSPYTPVFLFGLGSGAYLKALVNHTKEKVNIIVYEPSIKLFLKMLEEVDLSEEIENRPIAFFIEGINAEGFTDTIKKVLALENIELFKEEIHPNYRELFADRMLPYMKSLQKYVERIMVNYNTEKRFSINIAENLFKNLRYICEGYNTRGLAEAVPHDRAAVLVSAGPSLNKNINELKRAKNKLFILAVDTAIKPLMKAGIIPDAFCIIDANKKIDLINIDETENIPMIAMPTATYKWSDRQKGKKIFFHGGYAIPWELYDINNKEFPRVAIGGSVACSAFSILYKMGFETVILVGQDLALTNNRTHADGTFEEKMQEVDTEKSQRVKGNYEETVPTRGDFKIYLEWFSNYIAGAKKHDKNFRVINATEGGAYIEGTEIMRLKEALDETLTGVTEVDFASKIENMKSDFSEEERKKAVEYLHQIPEKYKQIEKDAKLLHTIYLKLQKIGKSDNIAKAACTKLLKKVKKLTKKITENPEYQIIDTTIIVADFVVRTEYYYENEDTSSEIQELARKGILYSEILEQCARLLKEISEEELLSIE